MISSGIEARVAVIEVKGKKRKSILVAYCNTALGAGKMELGESYLEHEADRRLDNGQLSLFRQLGVCRFC